MSNMSYCRFENTFSDLSDCEAHMDDELSGTEKSARRWLIEICVRIADEYRDELEDDDEEG